MALLAYAYDCIQGDGSLEINLHEVAGDMNEPYPTVKRWWATLRNGPFFASVTDRGRSGIKAQFSEDWIDRRILAKRNQETGSIVIPITDSPTRNTGSEAISIDVNGSEMAPNRDVIGTETGSLLNAVYIGTHDIQEDRSQSAAQAPTPAPAPVEKKRRALKAPETTQAELLETPLSIYRQVTNVRSPNQAQRELIATVEDCDLWRATCEQFALSGWNVRNVPNLIENYAKRVGEKKRADAALAARQAPYTNGANGHQPAERMPTPEETAAFAARYNPRIPGRTV